MRSCSAGYLRTEVIEILIFQGQHLKRLWVTWAAGVRKQDVELVLSLHLHPIHFGFWQKEAPCAKVECKHTQSWRTGRTAAGLCLQAGDECCRQAALPPSSPAGQGCDKKQERRRWRDEKTSPI